MSDKLDGILICTTYGDNSMVSNENGDVFVRVRGKAYYPTSAGAKGEWRLRQIGGSVVVRDDDGVAYTRDAGRDWYFSSLLRIRDISSASIATLVDREDPTPVNGGIIWS